MVSVVPKSERGYGKSMASSGQDKSQQRSEITAIQCKMARIAVSWGVRELAAAASVATDTIARLERGDELKPRTLAAVRETLEKAGIEFIPANGGGVGVRLKRRGQAKQRRR